AVHDELRPKVENARSVEEARSVMIDMISRLHQSHFAIIPADVYENIEAPVGKGDLGGSTGLELRVIDGKAIVTSVKPGMPAERAGVRPGWEIRAVKGTEIPPLFPPIEKEFEKNPRRDFYLWYAARARFGGAIGDTVTAMFMDGKDRPTEKTMILEEPKGKRVIFGNLPAFYLTFRTDTLRGGIGYFTFSTFFDPVTLMPAFGNAMQSFIQAPGVIIDVRGNPGGIAGLCMGMAGWFVEEKNVTMGTMRTRSDTIKLVINPRARAYRGPVAILVDGLSGSSSEIFAGGVQGLPRVRIFGSRTAGATLPSLAERLPNGDGFQYAFASYISRNGVELEGEGVKPDVEIRPTREALLGGRDPAIEAAVDWIQNQRYKGN
ncbi:MAG: S41 family peptidase, partial [Candidatus Krumholzibacteria bacterium]|nr:S41 family peptidase [Candidatus Krumholzibacteria bacterium]